MTPEIDRILKENKLNMEIPQDLPAYLANINILLGNKFQHSH